jgi:hypothetical protein
MTGFGRYDGQTVTMMNIELARILQNEREREIEADLRIRRLLHPTEVAESSRRIAPRISSTQRTASSGVASR